MLFSRDDEGPIQLFRAGRDLRTRWEATFPTNRGHWRQILMWLSPNRRGYSWVGTFMTRYPASNIFITISCSMVWMLALSPTEIKALRRAARYPLRVSVN